MVHPNDTDSSQGKINVELGGVAREIGDGAVRMRPPLQYQCISLRLYEIPDDPGWARYWRRPGLTEDLNTSILVADTPYNFNANGPDT